MTQLSENLQAVEAQAKFTPEILKRIDEIEPRAHSTLARKILAAAGVLPLAKAPGAGLRSRVK